MPALSSIAVTVTIGPGEHLAQFAKVIAASFTNDALTRYITLTSEGLPNDAVIPQETRVDSLLQRLKARAVEGPHFVEAGNFAAAAVWLPPGVKLAAPDRATAAEIFLEYYDTFSALKKKHMGDRQYYYLNLFGRNPERKDPGVIRVIMDHYLEKAKSDGLPAWLESTNEHARDVYLHLGFRLVEEVRLAVGKSDKNGYRATDGEGITLYAMMYEP